MRILITTGLGKTDIGGPFQYAYSLEREFQMMGHEVKVISYGSVERTLPVWIRHLYFLLRILPSVIRADKILALDTYSVGVPSVLAAKFFGKKIVIRIGGDFLWSAYVNRTGEQVTLSAFYHDTPKLGVKEKLILFFTKFTINRTDFLAFNTEWQRGLWKPVYSLTEKNSGVVRNFIPEKSERETPSVKNFVWAGRLIPEKNIEVLKKAGENVARKHPQFRLDVVTGESHEQILTRLKSCYAATSVALTDICPNFILEGISFNKPFVLSRETGLNELFPTGGIFIDPLDQSSIEAAFEALLDDSTYNKHVEDLKSNTTIHSWNELAKEFLGIWSKI